MQQHLVGTGGWAYFNVPGDSILKSFSRVYNFVEVNHTFYQYPPIQMVEEWRREVPEDFSFAVRCHQELTHQIGFKSVDEAYYVFNQVKLYCRILRTPFLVLETPATYNLDDAVIKEAKEFFSSANLSGLQLVWEIRSTLSSKAVDLMRNFNIVHCVDLSKSMPSFQSEVLYTRLFGKGKHNLYQFTDEELMEIDQKVADSNSQIAILSYHGARMYSDAARFIQYKKTGEFLPATPFFGVDSARSVLSEDMSFPSTKSNLIKDQGWKLIDLSQKRRIHLSELLNRIPERKYKNIQEVTEALRKIV